MHGYRHGCSDIYFVCVMKPLTQEIDSCPNEIAECKWMEVRSYFSHIMPISISLSASVTHHSPYPLGIYATNF